MQRATGFRPDLAPTEYAPGAGPDMPRVINNTPPGGNELSSTGQRGMPKYDPRGMDNTQPVQNPAYAAYAAEKQRQLDAGRAQREGALFNPPPPQKPVLQPGEVDMPIGHAGIGFGQDSALARDNPQFGMPAPGGNELSSTGQQGMPKYDPTGMGGGELSQPGGGGVMKMMKRGGKVTSVKKYAKGGAVKSTPVKASSRGDGIAQRGKTKGKIY